MRGSAVFVRHTILALAVSFPLLPLSFAHAATPRTLVAKVERVSDGGTLTALTASSTKLRLHLLGIDAPRTVCGTIPAELIGEDALVLSATSGRGSHTHA